MVAKVVRIRKALRQLHQVIKTASPEVEALHGPLYLRAIQLAEIASHLALEADRLRTDLDAAKARSKLGVGPKQEAAYERVAARLDALANALEATATTVADARALSAAELCEAAEHAAADLDLLARAASEVDAMTRD